MNVGPRTKGGIAHAKSGVEIYRGEGGKGGAGGNQLAEGAGDDGGDSWCRVLLSRV